VSACFVNRYEVVKKIQESNPKKKIRSAFEKQQPALTSGQLYSIKVHTMVEKGEKILRSDKNKNHRLFIG
jgi:hypothetical protein